LGYDAIQIIMVLTLLMERAKGVEPSTFSLATRRSTTELCPHFFNSFLNVRVNNTNNTSTLSIYLIIKPRTKQDSYVSTVSRLIQNRDPKACFWKSKLNV
jgi:hypothetical protein